MNRRLVIFALLSALLTATAALCLLRHVFPARDGYTLLENAGPWSLDVHAVDQKIWISWRPRQEYRPAWAGQTNRYGFRYTRWSNGSGEFAIPLWFIAATSGAAACVTLFAALRCSSASAPGTCPKCGYDLRATPDRCPECGATIGPCRAVETRINA